MSREMPSFREVIDAMKASGGAHQVCEINADGMFIFHGYSVGEVERLLQTYRDHLAAMNRLGQEIQSGMDAVRYQPDHDLAREPYAPVGPEDV